MKDFFKNIFSADEKKLSTVIIVLLIITCTGVYLAIKKTGDLPTNFSDCIIWLSCSLLGYNGLQAIRNTGFSTNSSANVQTNNQINKTINEQE